MKSLQNIKQSDNYAQNQYKSKKPVKDTVTVKDRTVVDTVTVKDRTVVSFKTCFIPLSSNIFNNHKS